MIIKCPSGHEVTPDQIHAYVDLKEPDIEKAACFWCEGGKRGHKFTLEKAIKSGMFTAKQGQRIKEKAALHRTQYTS